MDKNIVRLAQLIKLAAKDVSKKDAWWKEESISAMLGIKKTDNSPCEITVRDDSGYRCITIGDTRGNVSLDTDKLDNNLEHKGYMLLYSENCDYKNDKRIWKYRCFPSNEELAVRLEKVLKGVPLIPLDKNNCDYDELWYSDRDDQTLKNLSETIRLHVERLSSDTRTPQQIFDICMTE